MPRTKTILLLLIFKFLRGALFIMPVVVLFFESRGLSMTQVFLLQSIFSLGIVLFEVPTGYLWDMMTRKQSLLLGAIAGTIARACYYAAPWFRVLAGAEVLLALSYAFMSWSDVALLYDTLAEEDRIDQFKKIKGRFLAAGNIGEGLAAFAGGRIASFGLDLPILAQVVASAIGIIIVLSMREPAREKYEITETGITHLIGLIRYTFLTHTRVSALIVFSSFVGLSTMFRVWLAQPYRTSLEIPLARFGLLRGALNLSVGVFSLLTHQITNYISDKRLLLSFIPLSILAYALLGAVPALWMLPLMICFYVVRGVKTVVFSDILNKLISSKERATVLSLEGLSFRALFFVFGPLAGLAVDQRWLYNGLLAIAGLLVLIYGAGVLLLRRNRVFETFI